MSIDFNEMKKVISDSPVPEFMDKLTIMIAKSTGFIPMNEPLKQRVVEKQSAQRAPNSLGMN